MKGKNFIPKVSLFVLIVSLLLFFNPAFAEKVTITIAGMKGHPVFEADYEVLKDFQAKNPDIEVKIADIPYATVLEKIMTSLAAKSSEYDILWINDDYLPLFTRGDYLVPLDTIPELADDIKDMDSVELETITWPHPKFHLPPWKLAEYAAKEKHLYALPFQDGAVVLFYRKDLIKTPPKNNKEFYAIAKKLSKPPDFWGFAVMLKPPEQGIAYLPMPLVHQYGGALWDDKWNPTVNSPAGEKMAKQIYDMIWADKISPPAMPTYGRTETRNLIMEGKVAMIMEDSSVYGLLRDPQKSKFGDKIGMATLPTFAPNPKDGHINVCGGTWNWGINVYSKNKKEAVKVLKALISKEANIFLWKRTGTGVPRKSAKAELLKMDPEYKIVDDSWKHLSYIWTPTNMYNIPEWPEMNFKITAALDEYWTKQLSLKEALEKGTRDCRKILEEAGYYRK